MAGVQALSQLPAQGIGRRKSYRLSILRKIKHGKGETASEEDRPSVPQSPSPVRSASPSTRLSSVSGIQPNLPYDIIAEDFSHLRDAIVAHVNTFYTTEPNDGRATQATIEHASTGIILPWHQIQSLLSEPKTRVATLAMCISWTILSRSLLLKLGVSNRLGSSFLPPEIVECFQSFSLGKSAVTLDDEVNNVNFALLSRWKQISATLSHSAYVDDAFSVFDPRTVNIERALKDLDPLLRTYAVSPDSSGERATRLVQLREVLKEGAKFAFTLFSQPCFWKFDWASDRAVEHGKDESQLDPDRVAGIESGASVLTVPVALAPAEIVIWPRLLRVIDGDGVKVDEDSERLDVSPKRYLNDFGQL